MMSPNVPPDRREATTPDSAQGLPAPSRSRRPTTPPARPATGVTSRRLPPSLPPDPASAPGTDRVPRVPSALVYGEDRDLVNLLLFALAEQADRDLHWLEVRDDRGGADGWDAARAGWVDPQHAWTTDPVRDLVPDHARANAAIFELVRSDEPPAMLARLADFLRLPETMQRIIGEMAPAGGAHLLAVANSDRIAGRFPDSVLGPILDAFEWARCSLFVGYAGTNPPKSSRFTHIVRIERGSRADWRQARIFFEREALFAGTRTGGIASPLDLPPVARVFERAAP